MTVAVTIPHSDRRRRPHIPAAPPGQRSARPSYNGHQKAKRQLGDPLPPNGRASDRGRESQQKKIAIATAATAQRNEQLQRENDDLVFREAFAIIASDGSGTIEAAEVLKMLKIFGKQVAPNSNSRYQPGCFA